MESVTNTRRDFLIGAGFSVFAGGASTGGTPGSPAVIQEKPRQTPVVHECDICVIGGSCTGVFAAVRAARLGRGVALLENNGFFGGVATAAKVNVWHSRFDTAGEREIIGGLTVELIDRLVKRGAARVYAKSNPSRYAVFNSAEMTMELDRLVDEHQSVRPFLHALFVAGVAEAGRMSHAIIEDKSGRRALKARYFIDAAGDADMLTRIGQPVRKDTVLQPPTMCALVSGLDEVRKANSGFDLGKIIYDEDRFAEALAPGFVWTAASVGFPGVTMVAGTGVWGADCSDADQLTRASIEGRRQVRVIRDILHDNLRGGEHVSVGALPARMGVRETRHAVCRYRLSETEVLEGTRFEDAIANGSYRVDVHHPDKEGADVSLPGRARSLHHPGPQAGGTTLAPRAGSQPDFLPGSLPQYRAQGQPECPLCRPHGGCRPWRLRGGSRDGQLQSDGRDRGGRGSCEMRGRFDNSLARALPEACLNGRIEQLAGNIYPDLGIFW